MARALHPYAWGLRAARFDASALANGMLRAPEMSAVFPDGELYTAPHGDELPPPVALTALDGVSEADRELAATLLASVGQVVGVADDAALAGVTALSGSGPASG
ncbi:hypothetical protein G6F21_014568 [Rhizopus arrhizus]|nr:hypothetical protein G6F21_014568 [Rhizopus arrhizus]